MLAFEVGGMGEWGNGNGEGNEHLGLFEGWWGGLVWHCLFPYLFFCIWKKFVGGRCCCGGGGGGEAVW